MKISKRGVSAAIATVATGALLALGTPAIAANQTVTLWVDSGTATAIGKEVKAFGAKNGITVNVVTKDFGTLRAAAITAIPTGNGPDILSGAHDWTGKLVGAGVIAPVNLGANAKSFSSSVLSGFQVGGKLYGVPGWTENIALVYNKKFTSTPTTNLKTAVANGDVEVGFDKNNGDPYHFSVFSTSFGLSQYKRANGTWTTTIGMGGANGAKYAAWLASAKGGKALTSGLGWDQLNGQLQDGVVKYWVTGPWAVGALEGEHSYKNAAGATVKSTPMKASDIGVASFPSVGGSTVHQFSGVRGYWESVKVPGSDKAVSVGKVLDFLAGPVAQLASYNNSKNTPANQVALSKVADPIVKAFGQAGVNAYPMASFVFQDTTWSKIGLAEAGLIAGKGDSNPAKYWQDAITALQAVIDAS